MTLFELVGKIIIENSDAEKTLEHTKGIAKGVGNALATTTKVVGAAVVAGGTAVAGFVGKSVQAFAEYEQLVGGTELLFGAAFDSVIEKSKSAYKDVQMSQSEYLQQVNGFATGLKTALGGNEQAAADLAHKIITAEADVVAATGTSQEAVQNAFNGIMKSNFTMLDNLQLGITPTKEGFQEVINKVNEWNAANGNATKYQIDNLADCQSALVDYIAMQGLSGYAATEAAGTISGSLAMTKSAWKDLVSGMAQDNANIPQLVTNVVSSGVQTLELVIPVAKRVLQAIPAAISEISPQAGAAFQKIVDIVIDAFNLIKGAIEPTFALISNVFNFISQNTWVLTAAATAIAIVTAAVTAYNVVAAIKAAMAAAEVTTVWGLVAAYAAQAVAMLAAIAPYLLVAAAIAAVIAIGVALYKNWDIIKAKAGELGALIAEKWNAMKEAVANKVSEMLAAAIAAFESIRSAAVEKFNSIKASISLAVSNAKATAIAAFNSIKSGISDAVSGALSTVQDKFNSIKQAISDKMNEAWGVVQDIIAKVKNAFNFSLKLDIKLPHISVQGGEAPYGIGGEGRLPSFSVDWYAKAMNNAMVLSDPTIFGYSNGKFLGGGEAGNEVVAGEAHLMNLIGQAVENKTATQNAQIIDLLTAMLDAMVGGNAEMVQALMSDRTFTVGEREFARLVRNYA
jgi:phage-related protein